MLNVPEPMSGGPVDGRLSIPGVYVVMFYIETANPNLILMKCWRREGKIVIRRRAASANTNPESNRNDKHFGGGRMCRLECESKFLYL
jgi:hypothetical protein